MLAAAVMVCVAGAARAQAPAPAKAGRTLKVKLNYGGAGVVDEKHKIFLFVFDAPDFIQREDAMPIGTGFASAKDGTITVSDLATSPVYLVAVYDPAGNYDGMSKPPAGCSLAIYAKSGSEPAPIAIEPGKTVQVDLPFDDSFKMP